MFHTIEIKKLFAFCIVCETLSFTEAAKSLNLGQSTISHHISTLEKELGIVLFNRTSRSVELTPEGEKVYKYAKKIFDAFKDFENFVAIKDKEPIGKLCVYGGENALLDRFLETIDTFKDKFPKIDFDIVGDSTEPSFSSKGLSVGILNEIPDQPDLIQDYLMTFHLGLYASSSYLIKYGAPKVVADLDKHRLISFENKAMPLAGANDWLLSIDMPKGQKRSPYMIINTVPLLGLAAQKGLGIVPLSKESNFVDDNLIELLPSVPKPNLKVYLTYHRVHKNHPSLSAIENYLRNIITEKGWK